MILLGIDASFSRTGLCHIDVDNKRITIGRIQGKIGDKTFQNIINLSTSHTIQLANFINTNGKPNYVIAEEPFNGGEFSSGLHALDATFMFYLRTCKLVKEIYNLHPSYLTHLHGRGYKGSTSVKLAQKIIQCFIENGYTFNTSLGKVCHDEAEAIIFCTRLFIIKTMDSVFINRLLEVNSKLSSPKEKLLYKKEI